MDEKTWYLIGKKLAGEASQNELEQLHFIENVDPNVSFYLEEITMWWKLTEQVGIEQAEKIFEEHFKKIEEEKSFLSLIHKQKKQKSRCEIFIWLRKCKSNL